MPTTYAIPDGRTVMAATTYTGTTASLAVSNAVNGVSFQPDFVWAKDRTANQQHMLFDSIRGVYNFLTSNTTAAEGNNNQTLTGFNSNGFQLGTNGTINNTVANVAWQWKAGGTSASNTNGSITSTVSAGATQGFSVVTYTGNSTAGATVGHGLGVTPSMIIVKPRTTVDDWLVYHTSTGASQYLVLNSTAASGSAASYWGTPNSTTFGLSGGGNNRSSGMVAYCFAAVAGYSNAFSYTGNGSTDGPFQYLGFRPRWIMIKRSSSTGSWEILDTSRNPYNDTNLTLEADLSAAESTGAGGNWGFDILSNGFKIRGINSEINTSGQTYIGFAVAENPFKFANAR